MKEKRSSVEDSGVLFLGSLKTLSGERVALYNIIAANHPFQGSTVSERTLNKLNLQIPNSLSSKANENCS
jgi:hypothetical protein